MKARTPPFASVLALFLFGCASPTGSQLSYAEVQSLNPGVSAAWCIAEFPSGNVTRGPDGRVQTIVYPVSDPAGRSETLSLGFDAREVLCTKKYSGPVRRPPKKEVCPPPSSAPVSPCAPPSPFPQAP